MTAIAEKPTQLSLRRIFSTWWPLAASWLLMGLELPALSALVARLENPEINLAAYGGVVFPLALLIEAPIIMLLAASTAICKDEASYRLVRRFMMTAGASLTALHILVAFTPLYYVIVESIMGAPQEIVEPARIGLMIMTPWTWSIAYRRFNQGILIRFGYSQTVTIGTVIRLTADVLVLAAGYLLGTIPGIVVATSAVAAGVICEAIYSGFVVRPVTKKDLKQADPVVPPLTWKAFFDFYIPLAMTSLILLIVNPIGSAAMSRMPESIPSLAVWPVLGGFLFMLRSLGIAYNEVVVALLDKPRSYHNLRRFAVILAGAVTLVLLVLAATPLSTLWFGGVSALSPQLSSLAKIALWLAIPIPAMNVIQSWFQGTIVHGKRTRGVTEAVIIYFVVSTGLLLTGIYWGGATGIYVAILAMTIGMLAQTAWLWFRSRPVMREVQMRDAVDNSLFHAEAPAN